MTPIGSGHGDPTRSSPTGTGTTGSATGSGTVRISREAGSRARIVEAALASFAEFGFSKTTFGDVARGAGCSRATVYRYFPGKRALLQGVTAAEIRRVGAELEGVAAEACSLEDLLTGVLVHAHDEFVRHDALQQVLAVEPELILPYVVFEGAERLFGLASALLTPQIERYLERDDAAEVGEWLCRLAITYLFSPSEHVSLADEVSARHLVRTLVLPGIQDTETAATS